MGIIENVLAGRAIYCNDDDYIDGYCRSNHWDDWGRWVLLGIALLVFFLVLLTCSCTARRRRRRGAQPYYGTGWLAPGAGKYNTQNTYQMNPQQGYGGDYNYYNPPPAYGQPQPVYGGSPYNNTNQGYYGAPNQEAGVQQPNNVYQRDGVYSPPVGSPPTHKQ